MRRLLLTPALLLSFVGCQQPPPPEFATYRPLIHGGYTGEIRPILAPLSVQYGPHENVVYNFEITYKETIDGKTDTYTETMRFSTSGKLVGDNLMWTLDINELSSSTAKSLDEMTFSELARVVALGTMDREEMGEFARSRKTLAQRVRPSHTPRLVKFEPPQGAEGLPVARLHILVNPKGRVKDISIDFPAFEAVGKAMPKPGSKEYEDMAKEFRRNTGGFYEFNEKPVGVGDKLYRTRPEVIFGDLIRPVGAMPNWIVLGLTTHNGRPGIVAQISGNLMINSGTAEVPARMDGYNVIDLATGLVLETVFRLSMKVGSRYRFEMVVRLTA